LVVTSASLIAYLAGSFVYEKPELAVYGVSLYLALVVYGFVKGGVKGGVGAAALLALYAIPLWAVPAWITAVLALWYIAKRIGSVEYLQVVCVGSRKEHLSHLNRSFVVAVGDEALKTPRQDVGSTQRRGPARRGSPRSREAPPRGAGEPQPPPPSPRRYISL
jgi:hypothetical protein